MSTRSHQRLADTFGSLADALVDDFDLLDFLGLLTEKVAEHLDISAAAVILADQRGGWRQTAASDENAKLVELFTAQTHEGPCLECVQTAQSVSSTDLTHEDRWPSFVNRALEAGYRSAAAVPMRSRNEVIGSLTLLDTHPNGIRSSDIQLAQALADMATVGLLQHGSSRQGALLVQQLQAAFHHRIVIEQAKGVLAETANVAPADAYILLRDHARQQNQHLSVLARDLATGTTNAETLLSEGSRDNQ